MKGFFSNMVKDILQSFWIESGETIVGIGFILVLCIVAFICYKIKKGD